MGGPHPSRSVGEWARRAPARPWQALLSGRSCRPGTLQGPPRPCHGPPNPRQVPGKSRRAEVVEWVRRTPAKPSQALLSGRACRLFVGWSPLCRRPGTLGLGLPKDLPGSQVGVSRGTGLAGQLSKPGAFKSTGFGQQPTRARGWPHNPEDLESAGTRGWPELT